MAQYLRDVCWDSYCSPERLSVSRFICPQVLVYLRDALSGTTVTDLSHAALHYMPVMDWCRLHKLWYCELQQLVQSYKQRVRFGQGGRQDFPVSMLAPFDLRQYKGQGCWAQEQRWDGGGDIQQAKGGDHLKLFTVNLPYM